MSATPSTMRELTGRFFFLILVSTTGPLLFGYHLAELNAPQAVITCLAKSITINYYLSLPQCMRMTPLEVGVVSSIFTLGGLIGALSAGTVAARYGRLMTMRYTTLFFIIGPVFEATAANVGLLAFGRFISGLGAGAAVVVVPIYVSEITPPSMKGFFGSFTQVMINVGILITQLLGFFFSRGQLWRLIFGFGGIIGLVQFCGLLFASESPVWLADHGKSNQAKNILQRIRGHDRDIKDEVDAWGSDDLGSGEEETLLNHENLVVDPRSNSQAKKEAVGMVDVLILPGYRRATFAVMVVLVAQQFSGINSVVMYGVSLLSDVLPTSSALLNVFVAVLNLTATIAFAPLIDRLGRKVCLGGSAAGMATSALLLAFGISGQIKALSAIAVLAFVASFALGLGPIPFLLASELVGPEAVGATQSWALGLNWIATGMIAFLFPPLNQALGPGVIYYIFAAISAAFTVFVYLFIPETKGKKNADEVWGISESRDARGRRPS